MPVQNIPRNAAIGHSLHNPTSTLASAPPNQLKYRRRCRLSELESPDTPNGKRLPPAPSRTMARSAGLLLRTDASPAQAAPDHQSGCQCVQGNPDLRRKIHRTTGASVSPSPGLVSSHRLWLPDQRTHLRRPLYGRHSRPSTGSREAKWQRILSTGSERLCKKFGGYADHIAVTP